MTCLHDADLAIAEAERLRAMGFNVLASHPRCGHPIFSYPHARDRGLSAKSFERLARAGSMNLQIATGVRWGLAVADLDGELGRAVWESWCVHRGRPDPTWAVATPGGGLHLWYSLPASSAPLPASRHLWRLTGGHEGVEILGDCGLAMAPPSFKIKGGVKVRYRWFPGRAPGDLPLAPLPDWAAAMARVPKSIPRAGDAPMVAPPRPDLRWLPSSRCRFSDVLDAIGDKVTLARSWGVRIVGDSPNPAGWLRCRSIRREDARPSAMFSFHSGRYWEPELGRLALGLFELAVERGVYPDCLSARDHLASIYLRRRAS